MQSPDELRREIEALRDCIPKLSAAILWISVSLDVSIVLQGVVERAWSLSQFGPCSQRGKDLVPGGGFGSQPELNHCTLSGSARKGGSDAKKGRRITRRPFFDHWHE